MLRGALSPRPYRRLVVAGSYGDAAELGASRERGAEMLLRWRMKPRVEFGEGARLCESGLVKLSVLYRFRANMGLGLGLELELGLGLG